MANEMQRHEALRFEAVTMLVEYIKQQTQDVSDVVKKLLTVGRVSNDNEFAVMRKGAAFPHPTKEGWLVNYGFILSFVSEEMPAPPINEEDK